MPETPPLIYAAVTHDIVVIVRPEFLLHLSRPDTGKYTWAYHVTIENGGADAVQLVRRHWTIVDENGVKTEVTGEGVVGEKPTIMPGGLYNYSSGTPLPTPSGMMFGEYFMRRENGEEFSVSIPGFSLDSQFQQNVVH